MYSSNQSKISKVRAMADGKWDFVFGAYPQMNTAVAKAPRQVPCPVSAGSKATSTKFRFFKDWVQTGGAYHNEEGPMPDGIEVVSWLEGCGKSEAMDRIIEILGGDITQVSDDQIRWKQQQMEKARQEYCTPEEKQSRMNRVRNVAMTAIPAADAPEIHAYLRGRGLKGDLSKLPKCIRYHGKLRYPTSLRDESDTRSKNTWYSAMLGLFKDKNGNNLTLHRTFLNNGQKAPENNTKMVMAPPWDMRGGYIDMDQPVVITNEHGVQYALIGYCEGMETGLAIREATGIPMRPHYSSSLLKYASGIEVQGIPRERTVIVIFGDKDLSEDGQNTSHELAERLAKEGYEVHVHIPENDIPEGKKSVDWEDVYNWEGSDGFPLVLDAEFAVDVW